MAKTNLTAVIKKVTVGAKRGQYRFLLIGINGERFDQQKPNSYPHKDGLINHVIKKYFPHAVIDDKTV